MKQFFLLFFIAICTLNSISADTTYVIKPNDTLYSISNLFGVSVEELAAYNGIEDPRKLKEGAHIHIPSRYTVKKKDTLYAIARAHSMTVEELCKINGIEENHILKIGDILIVSGKKVSNESESQVPRQVRVERKPFFWPIEGMRETQAGKLNGAHIYGKKGDPVYAIASGEVVWSGPYRGFGQVVLVQSATGYVYIYGGNEKILVAVGDQVRPGTPLGTVGINHHKGRPGLFFSIFKDGKPVDLEKAPRI